MSTIIYNKKVVPSENPSIGCNDRGFTLGHGLFETIFIKEGAIPALDYHWKRLVTSAPMLDIVLPFSRFELESMLTELIIENKLQNTLAGARVTITHGESSRGILPAITPYPNFLITVFQCPSPTDKPFSALMVNIRKNEFSVSSRVKSISYLDNILAKKEAMDQGYDEAILLNTASNLADGSISNVFMVKDNQIVTPPILDGALPGVVRSILLQEFSQDLSIIERSISPAELMNADEIFLTNALMGIKAVNKLNTKDFYSFSVTNQIQSALRERKYYI
ncbi:MAG: aminotransferase class IV [Legionella sp.]|nr:aminotransferase class IV [Legionella sp.]